MNTTVARGLYETASASCDRGSEETSRRTSQKPSGTQGTLGRRTTTKVRAPVAGRAARTARGRGRLRPRGEPPADVERSPSRPRTRALGAPWARSGQLSWVESLRPTHGPLSGGRGQGHHLALPSHRATTGGQAAVATEESTLVSPCTPPLLARAAWRPRKLRQVFCEHGSNLASWGRGGSVGQGGGQLLLHAAPGPQGARVPRMLPQVEASHAPCCTG